MVNYPGGIKKSLASKPASTKSRGMSLEYDLNLSNQFYREQDKAIVYKKPIPIQVVRVDYPKRQAAKIVEAYYQLPSTTDYNGVYRGKALDFEAKETSNKTSFALKNIALHQIDHLHAVLNQQALAFLIIRFNAYQETYFVEAKLIIELAQAAKRSIPYSWFLKHAFLIPYNYLIPVDYIKVIDQLYF